MTRPCNDQKFEAIKDVIRRRKSQMARQCNDQKFEDTKDVIRRRKSKDRQYNDHKIPKV